MRISQNRIQSHQQPVRADNIRLATEKDIDKKFYRAHFRRKRKNKVKYKEDIKMHKTYFMKVSERAHIL